MVLPENLLAQAMLIARERGWLSQDQFAAAVEQAGARTGDRGSEGRYDVQERLGEGAAAEVFRAWDRQLKRPVALKLLRVEAAATESLLRRFEREAQATAGVSHPNVVAVHDVGEMNGRCFIAMELVEGRPLAAMLSARRIELRPVLVMIERAARGLAAAHEKGIVHRDVKPANILVAKDGTPKVADFGLAHLVGSETGLTKTGSTLGTPLYMAPEQVRGDKNITCRTDVYALGAILYEALTGRPPHVADTAVELYGKILMDDPVAPRRLNTRIAAALETVCLKALEKDPAKRYSGAKTFADDLRRFLDGEPVAARPAGLASRLMKQARRHKVATAVMGSLAAALIGLLSWNAWRAWAVSRWIAAAETAGSADEAMRAADAGLRLAPQHPRLEAAKSRALAAKQAADALRWLAKRRELDEEIDRLRRRLDATASASPALEGVRPAPLPPSRKEDRWKSEDELADLEVRRKLVEAVAEESAQIALRYDRSNATAIATLGDLMYERWNRARAERDARTARVWAQRLEQYDPDGKRRAAMEARSLLEIAPEPADAEAFLFRYEERGRRMIPLPANPDTGRTEEVELPDVDPLPLTASDAEKREAREGSALPLAMTAANRVARWPVELPPGAYLVVFRRTGHVDTRLPVLLEYGATVRAHVELARVEDVPPGFVYVPRGPYTAAYDRDSRAFGDYARQPQEVNVPPFCIARFPVTCGEYLEFLNDLPIDEAWARSPRVAPAGAQYWHREGGRMMIPPPFAPDWAVSAVSWHDAKAYAEWMTRKRGAGRWQFDLPSEEEWEKAAGGVLRWVYPWGNRFDPGFARIADSRGGETENPEGIGLFRADESPFGLRDVGGGMRTWTRSPWPGVTDTYISKGGAYSASVDWSRICDRERTEARSVYAAQGVRLAARRRR